MLTGLGLKDDYTEDGRLVSQVLDPSALPPAVASNLSAFQQLGAAYKQIEAPFGPFASDSEIVSTTAVMSESPGDVVYQGFDRQLRTCAAKRDAVGGQMNSLLQGAEFGGAAISGSEAGSLIGEANALVSDMHALSTMKTPPAQELCAGV